MGDRANSGARIFGLVTRGFTRKSARPMPAEARISSIWKKQKLFIAVFLLAGSAYFF